VYGEQVVGDSGVDVLFSGTMRFPGGVIAQLDCGLRMPNRDELEAVGEAGSVFLDDPWHCRTPVLRLRGEGGDEEIAVDASDSYRLELENVSDAIRGDAAPLLGREDAVGQARAIEALYRSAEEGRPVTLSGS
ncbi:MAG: Gfo/Idh/MocA family oxidoreductase, partial [Gaiellaceae bacterium]